MSSFEGESNGAAECEIPTRSHKPDCEVNGTVANNASDCGSVGVGSHLFCSEGSTITSPAQAYTANTASASFNTAPSTGGKEMELLLWMRVA